MKSVFKSRERGQTGVVERSLDPRQGQSESTLNIRGRGISKRISYTHKKMAGGSETKNWTLRKVGLNRWEESRVASNAVGRRMRNRWMERADGDGGEVYVDHGGPGSSCTTSTSKFHILLKFHQTLFPLFSNINFHFLTEKKTN